MTEAEQLYSSRAALQQINNRSAQEKDKIWRKEERKYLYERKGKERRKQTEFDYYNLNNILMFFPIIMNYDN